MISAAAGLTIILSFLATAVVKIGEFPGLPSRVSALERASAELTRDVKTIARDMESDARRSSQSFQEIHQKLAEMTGVLRDVRDQGVRSQSDLSAVKEKAANAAVLADDANRTALETRAKWDAEHSQNKK